MAYPFIYALTLDEFIELVSAKYGIEVKNVSVSVSSRYLVRTVKGQKKLAYLPPNLQGRDRLVPTQLRSLLAQLEIPFAEFGLTLG